MNTFTPSFRKAPSAAIAASNNSGSLVGLSATEVVAACQWKVTSGKGTNRAATGETFLNMLTPRLFTNVAPDSEEICKDPIPQIYANFDNTEGSIAVQLAEALSAELLTQGKLTDRQYYFKLIDSSNKETIASDLPEYEERETVESDLPDFLKPAVTAKVAELYTPDPKVCAFLHIYADRNGRPVRIASSNIEARFKPQLDVVRNLVANGHHIQAGLLPQTKVQEWLKSTNLPVGQAKVNVEDFAVATS